MAAGRYPFIDIAVHEKVSARFAKGDALVLLSESLDRVFWANGAGARLIGCETLYECLDRGLSTSTAAHRQIEAAARAVIRHGGRTAHGFAMRAGSGFLRPLVTVRMESFTLPDDTAGLLISADNEDVASVPEAQAEYLLSGFEGTDTHAAVLGTQGEILAATPSFARLDLTEQTRGQLVGAVAQPADRLYKHPVETALGSLPSAIARIGEDPVLYLLFTVEVPADESPADTQTDVQDAVAEANAADSGQQETGTDATPPEVSEPLEEEAETAEPDMEEEKVAAADEPSVETPAVSKIISNVRASTGKQVSAPSQDNEPPFVFDPERRPTRFVWKIDADGSFQEISKEFAEAVGPNAADVQGRRFTDVAQVFNIDPDRTIAELLSKRDTWSGKTVFWPVQGTDLQVPVDLAALPTYSRDREFDGFRGFGIVRPADATTDPERIGLALGDNSNPALRVRHGETDEPEQNSPSPSSDDDDKQETDTQTAEKPALEITETPGRRHADKVIRLEERRSQSRDGLSNIEKQAFREIAERLSGEKADPDTPDTEAQQPFGKRKSPPRKNKKRKDNANKKKRDAAAEDKKQPDEPPPLQSATESAGRSKSDEEPSQQERQGSAVTPDILEQLPTPIIIHDGNSIFYINEEFRQLTGYLTKSELNKLGGMLTLFDDNGEASGDVPVASDGSMVLVGSKGEPIRVRAKLRSVGWESGHALMLALENWSQDQEEGTERQDQPVLSIAESPQPDSELQVEVEELRSILETATDGVVLLGEDGVIRSMNKSASALFDYDESETTGRPFAMLFAHESQRAVKDYLSGLSGNGVASVLNDGREVIGREASGGFLPLFMTIGLLSGSKGYCAVMRDITHWKRAEEELRAAKRDADTANSHKTEFLARVSHEIRTPLNAIIGFAELMADEHFGPIGSPRYVEYARDIGRSGKHVLEIVNDLLDISKIEAGEQELDFGAVSLNDALMEAISILQPQANAQRVLLRTSLSPSVPQVVADQRSIKQIAINLLSNAIRFTPSGGQVVVSTLYEPSGNVSLRIRDTGVGMSRFELEQAMKPFKQVEGFQRPRGDGTGLGLPLAKAMAEANRAQFAMNSQPGQGTLVEIVFPSQRVLAE